jgi:hypothetical protein
MRVFENTILRGTFRENCITGSFVISILHKILLGAQVGVYELLRVFNTHGRDEK